MGWDEVKKVNSDMKVSLDVYQYLNDYKLWGKDSYVYQDKNKLHKLYQTPVVSMNDLELNGEALEYFITNNKHIGKALANVYGIDGKETLITLSNMTAVVNSPIAMTAVVNSPTAISSICKAPYHITKAFIKAINGNDDYIKKIFEIVTTNSSKFQFIVSKYENDVSLLNQHCNTPNTIILCALGYYNYNISASVNLFINNEKIKSSNTAGNNPQSVIKSNCNAIAIPEATFTKNSNGYAVVTVYKII